MESFQNETSIGPVVAGKPLLGFRKWKVDRLNGLLVSCTNDIPWQPGRNIAAGCYGHPSPGSDCHCGFNAWHEFKTNERSHYDGVSGAIAGAGRVELHGQGFRSSEAQIIALFSEEDDPELKEIAESYEIPLFDNKKEFLRFAESHASRIKDFSESELKKVKKEVTTSIFQPSKSWKKDFQKAIRAAKQNSVAIVPLMFVALFISMMTVQAEVFPGNNYGSIYAAAFLPMLIFGFFIALFFFWCSLDEVRGRRGILFSNFIVLSYLLLFSLGIGAFLSSNAISRVNKMTAERQALEAQINAQDNSLFALSLAQADYYKRHEEFASNPNQINPVFTKVNGVWEQSVFEEIPSFRLIASDDRQSYMLTNSLRVGDETSTVGLKGVPGEVASECQGELCDSTVESNPEQLVEYYEGLSGNRTTALGVQEKLENKLGFQKSTDSQEVCLISEENPFVIKKEYRIPNFQCVTK